MATSSTKPKLIVIVGPTASGKSEVALKIAAKYKGEIITADSRTVYKHLDIGTAKPSVEDQKKVPHWGLDLVEPNERFTAADFKNYATKKIKEVQSRGNLPILVGGTGLYIDSVIFDFGFRKAANPLRRRLLEMKSIPSLQRTIRRRKYPMPENALNKRHLIRAIEAGNTRVTSDLLPYTGSVIVGIWPPGEVLRQRINRRTEEMFRNGVLYESKMLRDKYPKTAPESKGLIYKICVQVLDNKLSEIEARGRVKALDWQYARRQRTWFKRNSFIKWFESPAAAEKFLDKLLNT